MLQQQAYEESDEEGQSSWLGRLFGRGSGQVVSGNLAKGDAITAIEEHLERLKQGVEQWNHWRENNPGISPNLEDSDLRGANLEGADLRDAILAGADLREANLCDADLSRAILDHAGVIGATYSINTRWPYRFEAYEAGARRVD